MMEYLVGPGLLLAGGMVESWGRRLAVGLPGFLLVAAGHFLGSRARERSDARYAIFRLLTVMVNTLEAARPMPADRSLRANLMLIRKREAALKIAYYTTGYSQGELDLIWHRGQGCAGEAWQRQSTVLLPSKVSCL